MVRVHDFHRTRSQHRDIFLRGGVIPHVHIHRRSDHDRSCASQIQGGEKIIGDAARKFRNDVGRGGGYEKKVRALRDGNMLDGAFEIGLAAGRISKEVGNYFLAA